ncbi:sugar MFS transporter [Pseudomonas ficuserectae]|uniref:Major facilitator family transporter n=8 Tax=Pseudomonas syringae group TaxID=136849 RepID=A0A3M4L186_PSEA0|nr:MULTISPECIES: MFS transporter [Pseudomonas]KWT13442.1 MFS transporter [Pseudomonas syringae pv. broussonetiae]ARA80126.1 MFS transporter [Pseudomonas amygdali pv. lachrymans]AXH56876.1 MFS transporter [Pseudomonas amygdali pv. lachrymans str. M301315]KKY58547.1 MFS transporter [Pseudomonas amygdali pv. lachrymans]KOP50973.1 MFS transporter [Pseudomonas coronafaciens pv. porri]
MKNLFSQNSRALYACYAAMACLAMALNFLPVYLTSFSDTFGGASGLTAEQLGRIPAVMFLSFIVAILVTGPLADRGSAMAFILIGLLITMAGLGVVACSPSYSFLLFAVAVMGFGAGVLDMILSPIVAALQPDRRSAAMNWLHAFFCVGAVGAVLIASVALRWGISWRIVSLVMMAAPLFTFLLFLRLTLPPLIDEDTQRDSMPALIRQPFFIVCLIAIFLGGATETGLSQWLPTYVEQGLGYSKEAGGFTLAGFSVGMALGRMVAAVLQEHVPPVPLMLGCCAVTAVLFIVISFPPSPVIAIAAAIAAGFSGSCLWPTMLAVSADAYPQGGATMFSVLTAIGNAGCSIVPWLVGVIINYSDIHIGLLAVMACPVGMMVLLVWMARWSRGKAVIPPP